MNNETEWDFDTILHRASLWGGIALALISIYFSYDGLDQTIQGGNPAYTDIAKFIGWAMAIVITLLQFIFNSDFNKLSLTLRVIGLVSYIYSIYTNYLGINHLFGFEGLTGWMIAIFMDVTPEALIAWSLDEVSQGDMLGNIGKFFMGVGRNRNRKQKMQPVQKDVSRAELNARADQIIESQKNHHVHQGRDRRNQLEKGRGQFNPQDTQPKINRFGGFGE